MPVAVLDEVQVLDQQVRPSRPVAEQRLHLSQRVAIELPALGGLRRLAASGTRMNLPLERARRSLWHGLVSDPGGLHSGPFDKGATRRSCAGLRRRGLAVTDAFLAFCTGSPPHWPPPRSEARRGGTGGALYCGYRWLT